MEFRESEPDYESILKRAGWRIYIGRETTLHGMKTTRKLNVYAIKFGDRVKVSATEEFEHGAWKELFEQAAQIDGSLIVDQEPPGPT
jgi:hypothetical protein